MTEQERSLVKMEKEVDEKTVLIQRQSDEIIALKSTLKEADKSREQLLRELSNSKDVQIDKIRDLEKNNSAEMKIQEKIIEALKKEKKELEQRYEDIITRYEIQNSKNSEEHHNMVKYFESLVGQYKQQLFKFSYP